MPPAWDTCKRCGAALRAPVAAAAATAVASAIRPPAPAVATVARPAVAAPLPEDLLPHGAATAAAPRAARRAEGELLPARAANAAAGPRRPAWPRVDPKVAVTASFVVIVVALWAMWPRDSGPATDAARGGGDLEILPPVDAGDRDAVLTSVFRVEAEAAAHRATTTVAATYATTGDLASVTAALLSAREPATRFVGPDQPSTSPDVVSYASGADAAVVAVAARGDICAFGRVTADMAFAYVTAKTARCRAADAPPSGWSGAGAPAGGAGVPAGPLPGLPAGITVADPGAYAG